MWNYTSDVKGIDAAKADFDALNPSNVRIDPRNGTIIGDLPDGTTVNLHTGTSTGEPTLGIHDPGTGIDVKIRF